MTQRKTIDEVVKNLREAVSLHLGDENPTEFRLMENPSILVTFELQPSYSYVHLIYNHSIEKLRSYNAIAIVKEKAKTLVAYLTSNIRNEFYGQSKSFIDLV